MFVISARHNRVRLAACTAALALASLLLAPEPARAQFGPPATTTVQDPSALRPPAGSQVAIIEFVDLQCPDCADAAPMVREAAAKYKIPLVRHDFPLPFHSWSFQAAVNARWFDTKAKTLGDEYRDYIFAHQQEIKSSELLASTTQTFASSHKLTFPVNPDPQGKLADTVKADYALGQRIGVEHTPTIWVVSSRAKSTPFIEVIDRSRLFLLIEQAFGNTQSH